ncbi:cytochrome c biogenesis protein CcdA [bacterium]|nr:cytochrome c biogenesis protein CcdA [bacterium]
MILLIAYLAGLLTLINPCVLPVLPIVLASSLHRDRRAPLALALGMSGSFVVLGLGVALLGPALGITEDRLSSGAALVMVAFGMIMVFPVLGDIFTRLTARFAARADASVDAAEARGLGGQFLGGALLGAVWSPCVGPTLGAAIGLASSGRSLGLAGAIMSAFALGVSTLILALAHAARGTRQRWMPRLRRTAESSKLALGLMFMLIGLGLYFGLNHPVEAWALQHMPGWLVDFSVSI